MTQRLAASGTNPSSGEEAGVGGLTVALRTKYRPVDEIPSSAARPCRGLPASTVGWSLRVNGLGRSPTPHLTRHESRNDLPAFPRGTVPTCRRRIMKVVIVGGVAGGASCAARLRRLDEKAEILMVERGPYVSYANCGLPYHVSGVIPEESSLLVATEQMFRAVFNVEVRTSCEAVAIDPKKKTVDLRDVKTGKVTTESYDKLVLSPGAAPIRPPLPGIDLPGIFSVRTVPDARTIREWLHRGEGDEDRDGLVHRPSGRHEAEAGGGGRRRVHRPRDGRELRPPRPRGDARREAEPGHAAARPGDVAARRALPRQARRESPARRRRRRLPAGRGRLARGPHRVREGPPGGRRDPRDRRAARDGAREGGRPRARRSAAGSASTST